MADEVEILRAVLRWSEATCQATYSSVKQHEIPVVHRLLSATESVAKRVNADKWLGSLHEYVNPVATTIDQKISRHVITALNIMTPTDSTSKSRSLPSVQPQPTEEEKKLKSELDTLQAVLRMIRVENHNLRQVETELEVLKTALHRFHEENDQLLQDNTAANIQMRHLNDKIDELRGTITTLEAELETAHEETKQAKDESKAMESDMETLRSTIDALKQKNANLQQELIDVQTYRESQEGQKVSQLEALLAESNLHNTLLEAENKKLKVKAGRSSSQKTKNLARTQSENLASH
ncbi:hypothetical protein THRCLA_20962 [Thraustotheca clavata]|uniref:Uncharacterized protein n=1 Tax=Thraustotheca clavata TaxID=74557 RepID=A0A1W0A1R6_9STRA|nr:hypothetical protein THRCLA_20962 [Thraustotheca clavata]